MVSVSLVQEQPPNKRIQTHTSFEPARSRKFWIDQQPNNNRPSSKGVQSYHQVE